MQFQVPAECSVLTIAQVPKNPPIFVFLPTPSRLAGRQVGRHQTPSQLAGPDLFLASTVSWSKLYRRVRPVSRKIPPAKRPHCGPHIDVNLFPSFCCSCMPGHIPSKASQANEPVPGRALLPIMPSPAASQTGSPVADQQDGDGNSKAVQGEDAQSAHVKHPPTESKFPEPHADQPSPERGTPSSPEHLASFDWDDFEARYENALRETNAEERETLKEAERLSKVANSCPLPGPQTVTDARVQYFQAWASAASAHDDERAVKRLRTRQRFVNLSEEKTEQKQQHCACSALHHPTALT